MVDVLELLFCFCRKEMNCFRCFSTDVMLSDVRFDIQCVGSIDLGLQEYCFSSGMHGK